MLMLPLRVLILPFASRKPALPPLNTPASYPLCVSIDLRTRRFAKCARQTKSYFQAITLQTRAQIGWAQTYKFPNMCVSDVYIFGSASK
jgi:hypothetical protein